jgi:hypothetical protein
VLVSKSQTRTRSDFLNWSRDGNQVLFSQRTRPRTGTEIFEKKSDSKFSSGLVRTGLELKPNSFSKKGIWNQIRSSIYVLDKKRDNYI